MQRIELAKNTNQPQDPIDIIYGKIPALNKKTPGKWLKPSY